MCQEKHKDWDRYLSADLFAYREVPQASPGFSPFELLYERPVGGPMQVMKELWTEKETPEVSKTYSMCWNFITGLKKNSRLPETVCLMLRVFTNTIMTNLLDKEGSRRETMYSYIY